MFAGDYAPPNWLICNGKILEIQGNEKLFSLIGTIYGGNGVTTFGLPNLIGRTAIGEGKGPEMKLKELGQTGGAEEISLTSINLPSHTHAMTVSENNGTTNEPLNNLIAAPVNTTNTNQLARFLDISQNPVTKVPFQSQSIKSTGNSKPHENLMPYTVVNYIICVEGIYPQ